MTDADIFAKLDELDADSVQFIRRGDGLSWAAHVRHKNAGPSRYAVGHSTTVRGAMLQAIGEDDPDDVGDLL